uniref:FAM21/CAPZIP domain-containing protein n=1 Tax=Mucochytrium quahogii TaxID=96639 RepID=A0A7S2S6N9_9STRA|mmetsp:Transcript_17832/g.30420  ORF Transcript_17832/g.30420 Transcript_17832/m.30420 type:complete len:1076 (+) Transcript_17832:163-3390(+)|eukprot:CAMPEP_0203745458 /NCGR_PEP_ID=MMETSP0098-20131031/1191_1 /ASSEMBLY_ACC=CAM_ASM_000208 /TAXON_ID=96639 /ORGANISM=" , Strain NY0313808BC1" /LENGTH=1075 /DNA_ID=CAMNT_0050633243 /DNA_START=175 /DNA_END=3402 /DNA_ORIENTATION=-
MMPGESLTLSLEDSTSMSASSHRVLVSYLKEMSGKLDARVAGVDTELRALEFQVTSAQVRLENAHNALQMLSNTQFIESRVYEEEEEVVANSQISSEYVEPKTGTDMERAIAIATKALMTEGKDADEREIFEGRRLPFVIGTKEFIEDSKVGLRRQSVVRDDGVKDTTKADVETCDEKTMAGVNEVSIVSTKARPTPNALLEQIKTQGTGDSEAMSSALSEQVKTQGTGDSEEIPPAPLATHVVDTVTVRGGDTGNLKGDIAAALAVKFAGNRKEESFVPPSVPSPGNDYAIKQPKVTSGGLFEGFSDGSDEEQLDLTSPSFKARRKAPGLFPVQLPAKKKESDSPNPPLVSQHTGVDGAPTRTDPLDKARKDSPNRVTKTDTKAEDHRSHRLKSSLFSDSSTEDDDGLFGSGKFGLVKEKKSTLFGSFSDDDSDDGLFGQSSDGGLFGKKDEALPSASLSNRTEAKKAPAGGLFCEESLDSVKDTNLRGARADSPGNVDVAKPGTTRGVGEDGQEFAAQRVHLESAPSTKPDSKWGHENNQMGSPQRVQLDPKDVSMPQPPVRPKAVPESTTLGDSNTPPPRPPKRTVFNHLDQGVSELPNSSAPVEGQPVLEAHATRKPVGVKSLTSKLGAVLTQDHFKGKPAIIRRKPTDVPPVEKSNIEAESTDKVVPPSTDSPVTIHGLNNSAILARPVIKQDRTRKRIQRRGGSDKRKDEKIVSDPPIVSIESPQSVPPTRPERGKMDTHGPLRSVANSKASSPPHRPERIVTKDKSPHKETPSNIFGLDEVRSETAAARALDEASNDHKISKKSGDTAFAETDDEQISRLKSSSVAGNEESGLLVTGTGVVQGGPLLSQTDSTTSLPPRRPERDGPAHQETKRNSLFGDLNETNDPLMATSPETSVEHTFRKLSSDESYSRAPAPESGSKQRAVSKNSGPLFPHSVPKQKMEGPLPNESSSKIADTVGPLQTTATRAKEKSAETKKPARSSLFGSEDSDDDDSIFSKPIGKLGKEGTLEIDEQTLPAKKGLWDDDSSDSDTDNLFSRKSLTVRKTVLTSGLVGQGKSKSLFGDSDEEL